MDLVTGVREYVYPVGRLDFDTEGLLLLTNDGELAAQLTHPRHAVARVYEVQVLGVPDAHAIGRLMKGVTIDGRRTGPAQVQPLPGRQEGHARLRITVAEGRNRQVRRMTAAVGLPCLRLVRWRIGAWSLEGLAPGQWREVEELPDLRGKRGGDSG